MRACLQRVRRAAVRVEGELVSEIKAGLLIFLGVETNDGPAQIEKMVRKISGLRVFEDDEGRMNRSCEEIEGEYLIVSQFTLAADLTKGKRPSFDGAMRPPKSQEMYDTLCANLGETTGRPIRKGRFGAMMMVDLENDGPATFLLHV